MCPREGGLKLRVFFGQVSQRLFGRAAALSRESLESVVHAFNRAAVAFFIRVWSASDTDTAPLLVHSTLFVPSTDSCGLFFVILRVIDSFVNDSLRTSGGGDGGGEIYIGSGAFLNSYRRVIVSYVAQDRSQLSQPTPLSSDSARPSRSGRSSGKTTGDSARLALVASARVNATI